MTILRSFDSFHFFTQQSKIPVKKKNLANNFTQNNIKAKSRITIWKKWQFVSESLSKIQKNVKSFQKTVKNSTKTYYEQTRQKNQKSKKFRKKVLLNKVNKIRKWMIKTF